METKINWFPGHMAKANKQILDSLSQVDLVLEVVDARAINASSNPSFNKLNKPFLKVALKADLADVKTIANQSNLIIGSTKDRNFKKVLLTKINQILQPLATKKKAKGIANPTFYLMVVGLPNVGKSSLINFLANKNLTITGNKPAVTKTQSILKISDNLFLQDNPGVFFKKIDSDTEGFILALINTIKKEVLPLKDVINYCYDFFKKHYANQFNKYFGCDGSLSFNEFIKWYAQKRHFLIANNQPDLNRALDALFDEFVNGKVCKVNYEK